MMMVVLVVVVEGESKDEVEDYMGGRAMVVVEEMEGECKEE